MNYSKLVRTSLHSAGIGLVAVVLSGAADQQANAQSVGKSEKISAGLYEIVVSDKTDAVYVAAAGSRGNPNGQIFKLDPNTLAKTDSIDVKIAPGYGLGINQKTQTLYTSNTRDNSVHAIDLKSGRILATINNGKERSHTREIVVDEDKNLAYVSDVGKESSIWVIDGKTNKLSHLIENTGQTTTGLALDKKRNVLYVTNMGTNEVAVIDLSQNKVVKSYPTGGEQPINLIYDAKGDRLFVSQQGSGNVAVLNASNGEIIKTITAGEGAIGINFDEKRKRIYVANRRAGNVTVIHSDTYEVLANLPTGTHPNTVAINKKTGAAYVTNKARGQRPVEGQPAPGPDPNGDTVSLILPN